MNKNQYGLFLPLFLLVSGVVCGVILGFIGTLQYFLNHSQPPATATSTYGGLTAFQWSQVAQEYASTTEVLVFQRQQAWEVIAICEHTPNCPKAPVGKIIFPTSTDAESDVIDSFGSPAFIQAASGTPCWKADSEGKYIITGMSDNASIPNGGWYCTLPASTPQVNVPIQLLQKAHDEGYNQCMLNVADLWGKNSPEYQLVATAAQTPQVKEYHCQTYNQSISNGTPNPTKVGMQITTSKLWFPVQTLGTSTPEEEGYSDCTEIQ